MTDSEKKSNTVGSRLGDIGARPDIAEQFPEHLRTRFTEIDLICPKCRSEWHPGVAAFVNVKTDPAVKEGVLRRSMHRSTCPACKGYTHDIMHIWDYYDPDEQLIIQVRMDWEYKAGGGEEVYYDRLEKLVMKYQEEDVRVDVVFGMQEFIDKYLGGEEAVAAAMRRRDKEIELKLAPGNIRADNEREYFGDVA